MLFQPSSGKHDGLFPGRQIDHDPGNFPSGCILTVKGLSAGTVNLELFPIAFDDGLPDNGPT